MKLLIAFLTIPPLIAQGGWNIKYNPINTLNETYIGKNIFIDFKKDENDVIHELKTDDKFKFTLKVRALLANIREHEIELTVQGEKVVYREDWRIFSDMGMLDQQVLVHNNNRNKIIKDIYLEKITKTTLCLRANLYHNKQDIEAIKFEVPIAKVKGFLTRI